MPLIEVPNATFQPCMDSFLGAAAGVMRALGDEQDMEDLWGLSGLALNTQVHRTLDPVGLLPRQWDETLSSYMRRFGHESIAGLRDHFYTAKDLRELQFVWMDTIEKTLNDGRPALAYGLHGPAFGIIRGFDSDTEEYHVSTFMDGTRNDPINIQDFGSLKPPLIFVMLPAGPLAGYDYNAAAREAIAAAIDHHLGQEKDKDGKTPAVPPDIVRGVAAYNAWSAAIETGAVAPHWGIGLYSAYYTEARSAGAEWLRRLAARPEWSRQEPFLAKAAAHFDHEVECFRKLPALFPLKEPGALADSSRRTEASACLRLARAEHIAAMEELIEGGRFAGVAGRG